MKGLGEHFSYKSSPNIWQLFGLIGSAPGHTAPCLLWIKSDLNIGDREAEEQVHDDDGDEEDEQGDQDVGGEGKELRLRKLVDLAGREAPVREGAVDDGAG